LKQHTVSHSNRNGRHTVGEQDKQFMFNVTLRGVRVTIAATEKK